MTESENQADAVQESSGQKLDLSELSKLDLGPSWTDNSSRKKSSKEFARQNSPRGRSSTDSRRDRRGSLAKGHSRSGERDSRGFDERKHSNKDDRRNWNQSSHDNFQPTVKIDIYPDDEAFGALVKRLRATVRTYQLFEIAHLILEKPERYVLVVQNKAKKDGKPEPLYFSVQDHLAFETEDAAINHVLKYHLESYFDIEEIELEPPKGNFQMVNRCTITGELLGPPNYHRYQEFLQRHYAARINTMSFDNFVSKVESVKEQESIDAWVEAMKKGFKYLLKNPGENDPESFESLEAVRFFLLKNRKDGVVGSGEIVRFPGRSIERLPKGAIRRSIETYIENQLQFPLDTANNIRGRLRRHNFTVYKKGTKGISYVCAVKRKFRDSKTVFAASIQELIEFIEKNPNVPASRLSEMYLKIAIEKPEPEKLEIRDPEVTEEQPDVQDETSTVSHENGMDQAAEESEVPTEAIATSKVQDEPKTELKEEELRKLNQLMIDLRWLISEGYVTEYGDGRLFASQQLPDPKPKKTKVLDSQETEEAAPAEAPVGENTEAALLPDQDSPEAAENLD